MKNEFVPYDLAEALKEKGFNEPCFGYYWNWDHYDRPGSIGSAINIYLETRDGNTFFRNDDFSKIIHHQKTYRCSAPLYQQAIRFFEEKNLYLNTSPILGTTVSPERIRFMPFIISSNESDDQFDVDFDVHDFKEDALNKAIKRALELI